MRVITIDQCQGCKHWHTGIEDECCAGCRAFPPREDGHPLNYVAEVITFTTLSSVPPKTESQIQPITWRS